jgi:hypothetical protein
MQNFHFCRLKLFFSHGFQRLHCSACVSLGLIGEVTKVFRSRNWRGLEIEDLIEDLVSEVTEEVILAFCNFLLFAIFYSWSVKFSKVYGRKVCGIGAKTK